jgi:hypothetical protein
MNSKKMALSFLKKPVIILLLGIAQLPVNAQEPVSPAPAETKKTSPISLGISGGIDYNYNTYYTNGSSNYSDKYVVTPTYNARADFGLRMGNRCRLRVELNYATMAFGANYQASGEVTSTAPEKVVLWFYRLGFTGRLDFRFLTIHKLDVLFTPGLTFEYRLYQYEKATYTNGGEKSTNYLYSKDIDYTHKLSGAVGGFIFRYNLNNHWGITLSPEYTYFFKKLYSQNAANLQRVSINLGAEWKF